MKVIMPVAGKGTRLLPITKHVPKPLVRVAGRPVLDYVVDRLAGLDVEEWWVGEDGRLCFCTRDGRVGNLDIILDLDAVAERVES